MKLKGYKVLPFLACLAFIAALFAAGGGAQGQYNHANNIRIDQSLPVVGSYEKLVELTENNDGSLYGKAIRVGSERLAVKQNLMDSAGSAPANNFSATNIQVAGVDEADIVKTDGEYIYQVSGSGINITRAYPAQQMEVIKTIDLQGQDFNPHELYIDKNYLVVTGHTNSFPGRDPIIMDRLEPLIYPAPGTAKALVYDIRNKNNIHLVREVETEGRMITSRKIGSKVYLLSNRYLDLRCGEEGARPAYRDSAAGKEIKKIPFDRINYFPGCRVPNYLIVASFDLNNNKQEAQINTYLGPGENVYMSHDNLYVAVTGWEQEESTTIYKFNVNGTSVSYSAKGKVPGTVLNQFSMDEHKEHFRIATTTWRQEGPSNHLFVLDKAMNLAGEIRNLAPGERIYSARFMGDRAYLVTFELVDPLFVLDLANPKKPVLLGELKIPGFSNYLHPLDDNHLLGIGKDTTVTTGWGGQPMAIELGIKMAVFDVRDVHNPVEKHVEIIGGRGTHAEVLHNHKALLFDQSRNLLAFGLTVHESPGDPLGYGKFTFQGACVYNIDLEKGFQLKGRITHNDNMQPVNYRYAGDKEVKRVLYINDLLYAVSDSRITAHRPSDLSRIKTVNLK